MNELTKKEQNSLSHPTPDDFWSNLDSSDFATPRCSVGQGTSKEGIVPGEFNFNNKTHTKELLNCKLIVPSKTRVLYDGQGPAKCGSDDYYHPSPRFVKPISSNCMTCYAAAWGDDEQKVRLAQLTKAKDVNKPLCKETYNLLMADANNNPFFVQFQGVQLAVIGEELFSRLRYDFAGQHPATIAFDMKVVKKHKGTNSWYQAEFSNFRQAESPEICLNLYKAFSKKAKDILAKQHEAMDAEKVQAARIVSGDDWPPPSDLDSPPVIDERDEIPF